MKHMILAVAVVLAGVLNGAPVKSMVAEKQIVTGGFECPYITDGLIAMWDGIWNAGWGKHTINLDSLSPCVGDSISNGVDRLGNDNIVVYDNRISALGGGLIFIKGIRDYENSGLTITALCNMRELGPVQWNTRFGGFAQLGTIGFYHQIGGLTITSAQGYSTLNTLQTYSTVVDYSVVYDSNNNAIGYFFNGQKQTIRGYTFSNYARKDFLMIGCQYGGTADFYNVRVYNRALSAAEIAHNYAVDKARFNLP